MGEGEGPPPVTSVVPVGDVGELRRTLLEVLAAPPEGTAVDDLRAVTTWRLPAAGADGARVAAALAEAELLGLTVAGRLRLWAGPFTMATCNGWSATCCLHRWRPWCCSPI